eukprot:485959_1
MQKFNVSNNCINHFYLDLQKLQLKRSVLIMSKSKELSDTHPTKTSQINQSNEFPVLKQKNIQIKSEKKLNTGSKQKKVSKQQKRKIIEFLPTTPSSSDNEEPNLFEAVISSKSKKKVSNDENKADEIIKMEQKSLVGGKKLKRTLKSQRGILFYQKSWYTQQQMKHVRLSKNIGSKTPKMMFGDNDVDNKRELHTKRQYFGGQAKVMGYYDKDIAFGIVTTFYASKFPKLNHYKAVINKQFEELKEHLLNGNDVVIPKATNMDIKANGKDKYFKNDKQVIFHNIGTGIAQLKDQYISYIQLKIDQLGKYAKCVKYVNYYGYNPRSDHIRNKKQQQNWICVKCKYSNWNTRNRCRRCKNTKFQNEINIQKHVQLDKDDKIAIEIDKLKREKEKMEEEKKKQDKLLEFYKSQLEKEKLATEKAAKSKLEAETKLEAERKEFEMKQEMKKESKTKTKMSKNSKIKVKWQWYDDVNWISYDAIVSKSIELCNIGESYEYIYTANGQTYKITRSAKKEAIQINVKTNVQRKVRRIEQTAVINDACDDIKWDKQKIEEYVRKKINNIYACIVSWQWQNDDGEWYEYNDLISKQIEFQSVGKIYQFECDNGQKYKIRKKTKGSGIQINVKTNKYRIIRRIENFETDYVYPKWWNNKCKTKGLGVSSNYAKPQLRRIDLSVGIGKEVKKLFDKTVSSYKIVKIESVENQMLYDAFLDEKKKLSKLVGRTKLNVKNLFHGTKSESVMDAIQIEGFRKEFSNTAVFGQGSYFAKNAKYSVNYAAPMSNGIRKMFMCKVICGKSTKGCKSYGLKSWPKKKNGLMYDSLVNDEKNPTIFVIHENYRCYPLFVIYFK